MSRTIEQLAQEALNVQNACNLSGVVHSFSSVISDLWLIANQNNQGTKWINEHPISILFADKIAQLVGNYLELPTMVSCAFRRCEELSKGEKISTDV
jgi:hypothetical protein